MKLYKVPLSTGASGWFGTQAEARAGARQMGTEFESVEVPTDKPGLLSWLNENCGSSMAVDRPEADEPDPLHAAEQRAIEERRMVTDDFERRRSAAIARQQDTDALVDWLLEAEAWQVVRVFEALGSRFGDLVRGGRSGQAPG